MMTVNERARRIATFRGIEVRLMEMAARWTPLIPEMELKVLLGRHIWNFAQNADWLGKRTYELRQPMHYTLEPAPDYREFLDDVARAESTATRLGGLYKAVLPTLIDRYEEYLSEADVILDEPSIVIIERVLGHHRKMIAEAETLVESTEIEIGIDEKAATELRKRGQEAGDYLQQKELAS